MQALIAAWEAWADRDWLAVDGLNLRVAFVGADAPWRRRGFDRRLATGAFAPAPGPASWARARSPAGAPPAGADTLFRCHAGRSRFGETETLIGEFVHLARSGHGCFFLDPHEDALNRMKPYLTDVADRVVEINLAPRGLDHRQAGWNLFSMEHRTPEDMEMLVSAVVDSFASALRWGEINNRALTLTTMAAKSLVELAGRLPPELAPTIFQITTLLSDADWRDTVAVHLSRDAQVFWSSRFPKLGGGRGSPR